MGSPPGEGQGEGISFVSDFVTSAIFTADALPPNELRVSLPVDAQGEVVPLGEVGQVFVCGGPQLAVPGTTVVIENATTLETVSVDSTDLQGTSGSTACDVLFPGRCDTTQPGTFCAVLDGSLGERMLVTVEDVLGNFVTLDGGNMRDEITGAEVIGAEGGVVTFPGDERYSAIVREGAFDEPVIVQLTPIRANPGQGELDLEDFVALTNPSLDPFFELLGAVQLDLDPVETEAKINIDISVPYPAPVPVDAQSAQYIATEIVNFRGVDELTMVDTAFFDSERELVITDPGIFPGLIHGGSFGLQRAEQCLGYVTGYVSTGNHSGEFAGYAGGSVLGGLLPFPVDENDRVRLTVPLPCNTPVSVAFRDVEDNIVDPGCGCTGNFPPPPDDGNCEVAQDEIETLQCTLSEDFQPPAVESTSIQDGEEDVDPLRPLEVILSEPIDPTSAEAAVVELRDSQGRLRPGRLVVSGDGRTVTFVPDIRLYYDEEYTLTINGLRDVSGNPLPTVISRAFRTFKPQIVLHIPDVDARDVLWLERDAWGDPPAGGPEACEDVLVVIEGDAHQPDFQGGINCTTYRIWLRGRSS